MIQMHITKMHGLGNSQILVEDLEEDLEEKSGMNYGEIARALCHPSFGVGADQTLIILPSEKADFRIRIFNRDRGEAEMCGNGIRCVAKYLFDRGLVGEELTIETMAGIKDLKILSRDNGSIVEVDMGEGKLTEKKKEVCGREGSFISVGNPHFVIFTEDASEELAREEGPILEEAEEFQPEKANIEFAKLPSRNEIETYVWERGAGLTLACGTGGCATAFAAKKRDLIDSNAKIILPGGILEVKIDDEDQIKMRGPTEYILSGDISDISEIHSTMREAKIL